jgi:Flp pilus assembly secretin CpaC
MRLYRQRTLWAVIAVFALACAVGCTEEFSVRPPTSGVGVGTSQPAVEPATRYAPPLAAPPGPKLIEAANGKMILIYSCRYIRSEMLKEAMSGFVSPEGTVECSPAMNTLIVSDTKDLVPGLLAMARELDRPVPQVLVEARVVEVTVDSDLEIELNQMYKNIVGGGSRVLQNSQDMLATPGANPNTNQGMQINIRALSMDGLQLDLFLRMLVTKGKARILSSPNLIVTTGAEASIITGEEVPVQSATVVSGSVSTTTNFKRVGIKLRVTPQQIAGDTARLEINPEVSTVTGYTAAGPSGISNPVVAIRNVRTILSIKDGQVLTIGGLLREEDRQVLRKVPGLGDVPTVGLLFQSRREQNLKTQLIFFLRINILPPEQANSERLHKPGVGMEDVEERVRRAVPDPNRPAPASRPADEPEWIYRAPPPPPPPLPAPAEPDTRPTTAPASMPANPAPTGPPAGRTIRLPSGQVIRVPAN